MAGRSTNAFGACVILQVLFYRNGPGYLRYASNCIATQRIVLVTNILSVIFNVHRAGRLCCWCRRNKSVAFGVDMNLSLLLNNTN